VAITSSGYRPSKVHLPVGGRVTWVNRQAVPQSVQTWQSWYTKLPSFDLHTLREGQRKSHTFRKPGRYEYFSSYDANRYKGVVIVSREQP
jgi:plastocyanin